MSWPLATRPGRTGPTMSGDHRQQQRDNPGCLEILTSNDELSNGNAGKIGIVIAEVMAGRAKIWIAKTLRQSDHKQKLGEDGP